MTAASLPAQATVATTVSGTELAQLRRLRWAVRAVLTLGVAASIAANVLHARPNLISQIIAAWPPVALLLTVELISRVPAHRRSLAVLRLLAAATIAGIAAWVSYWHMAGVAIRYGETGAAAAYLLPVSVDGLVVVASISLVEIAGRIRMVTAEPVAASGLVGFPPAPADGPDSTPSSTPIAASARRTDLVAPNLARDARTSVPPDRGDGRGRQVGDRDESSRSAPDGSALPNPDPAVTDEQSMPPGDEPAAGQRARQYVADAPDAPPRDGATEATCTDEVVPANTAAAVAYWHRLDPSLHPADIAAKIGRSERTVRRYWPPTPERGVNGRAPGHLEDRLRSA
jgi:hypothetical protein